MISYIMRQIGLWLYNIAQADINARLGVRQSMGMGIKGIKQEDEIIFPVNLERFPVETITITDRGTIPLDGMVYFDDRAMGSVADCLGEPRYCPLAGPKVIRICGGEQGEDQEREPYISLHIVLR